MRKCCRALQTFCCWWAQISPAAFFCLQPYRQIRIYLLIPRLWFVWKGKLSISPQNFLFINQLHICSRATKTELKQQQQKKWVVCLEIYMAQSTGSSRNERAFSSVLGLVKRSQRQVSHWASAGI